jgi:hypothetical protein
MRPVKTTTDLFATMEDDIKQFWGALAGVFCAAPGAIAKRMAMPTRRDFVDLWDSARNSIVEHLAGVEDFARSSAERPPPNRLSRPAPEPRVDLMVIEATIAKGARERCRISVREIGDCVPPRGAEFFSQEVRKMSAPGRRALVAWDHGDLSIRRQCVAHSNTVAKP